MTHLVKQHLKHDSPSICNHFSIFVEVEYVVKFRELCFNWLLICHYSLTKNQSYNSAGMFRKLGWNMLIWLDSYNVDLHRVLLVWDGMGLPSLLPRDFIKQWLEGKPNFIKYEVHFVHIFTLLVFSSWERCEMRSLQAKQ